MVELSAKDYKLYIGGKWLDPALAGKLDVINPATEEVIGHIPAGSEADVNLAVEAARATIKSGEWSKATGAYRAGFLRKIAAEVRARQTMLAELETKDSGKTLDESNANIAEVAVTFDFYAGLAEKLDTMQDLPIPSGSDDFSVTVRREALGVVGLITPWNFPLLMAAWKVPACLAAGNCCILKPSELASMTCLELARICHDVGLPAGVFNVVTGLGMDVGAPLSAHVGVDKISFTGSTATGRKVATEASANLRPVAMELGGKSPMLVFEDADVSKTVEWAMFGCFLNTGQICSATSRLLVHKKIAPALMAQLKLRAESIKMGDPIESGVRIGAIVCKSQYEKVMGYVQVGKDEGAKVLTGGARPAHLPTGYFLAPTVFTGVTPEMRVWKEEIFGPVISVMEFETEEEALRLANDSEYGLAGSVISSDPTRCERVAKALECGVVWVNCAQRFNVQAPWGGIKNSGFGRELGQWGLESFMTMKQVTSYVSPNTWGWYPGASQ
eukprot:CAMPEP_0119108230 /NCGR_PEP_ID=MMETSP1180-20130426/13534_1 /TAXON_ID=3052 ORGANISM="Chlamydomonas cf sp, Strain CCMP681" /NCGR_SAMPLE_ID=MMETSP1180 /ASSEMBLY_ACC=CAM_ASM_000741 /LENGTH=500 /DNA_ID=CAMNT_0007093821 /DNA_START=78 /DNA_END=1580 /DNA_ORIENTATION=+